MACNFIHCFRNPGGDYEWADWDKPPPRYWMKNMAALFGYSDESESWEQMEQDHSGQMRNNKINIADTDRYAFIYFTICYWNFLFKTSMFDQGF